MKVQLTISDAQVAILHNNMTYAYIFDKQQNKNSPALKELLNLIAKANGILNEDWENNGSLKIIR